MMSHNINLRSTENGFILEKKKKKEKGILAFFWKSN